MIAGGQTLVPMLAMRLARPTRLIDILRLPELAGIREEAGAVVVGATTRQAQAERDPVIRASVPMLARVLPWVGHPPTRNRGTVGGSIANADPSAEIPLVAVTLGAEILLATAHGERSMSADDFFVGAMLTAIGQGDCVRAIRFPVWPYKRIGTGFFEISARRSDFAFVAAAAQVALDDEDRCHRGRARHRRRRRKAVAARCIVAHWHEAGCRRRCPTRSMPPRSNWSRPVTCTPAPRIAAASLSRSASAPSNRRAPKRPPNQGGAG